MIKCCKVQVYEVITSTYSLPMLLETVVCVVAVLYSVIQYHQMIQLCLLLLVLALLYCLCYIVQAYNMYIYSPSDV
jgi:hypothetical protein